MPSIALPIRPEIIHFFPFTDRARLCCEEYHDDGTHLDTEVRIYRVTPPESLVIEHTFGEGRRNFTVFGISLVRGVVYRARIRYKNETGWSKRSRNVYEKVGPDLPFAALAVPTEPLSGGLLPIQPSYPVDAGGQRVPMVDRVTGTGHLFRRPQFGSQRISTTFVWENISTADKDTLVAFLQARIKPPGSPPQAFQTTDAYYGSRYWATVDGMIEVLFVAPGVWTVNVGALEVEDPNVWTVGTSAVDSLDAIG